MDNSAPESLQVVYYSPCSPLLPPEFFIMSLSISEQEERARVYHIPAIQEDSNARYLCGGGHSAVYFCNNHPSATSESTPSHGNLYLWGWDAVGQCSGIAEGREKHTEGKFDNLRDVYKYSNVTAVGLGHTVSVLIQNGSELKVLGAHHLTPRAVSRAVAPPHREMLKSFCIKKVSCGLSHSLLLTEEGNGIQSHLD